VWRSTKAFRLIFCCEKVFLERKRNIKQPINMRFFIGNKRLELSEYLLKQKPKNDKIYPKQKILQKHKPNVFSSTSICAFGGFIKKFSQFLKLIFHNS
jgi:hypothetical protein